MELAIHRRLRGGDGEGLGVVLDAQVDVVDGFEVGAARRHQLRAGVGDRQVAVVAPEENQRAVAPGPGLEGHLHDGAAGLIQDRLEQRLQVEDAPGCEQVVVLVGRDALPMGVVDGNVEVDLLDGLVGRELSIHELEIAPLQGGLRPDRLHVVTDRLLKRCTRRRLRFARRRRRIEAAFGERLRLVGNRARAR